MKMMRLMQVSLAVALAFLVSAAVLLAGDYVVHGDDGQIIQMNDDDGIPTVIAVLKLGPDNLAATDVDTNREESRSVTRNVTMSGSPSATPS